MATAVIYPQAEKGRRGTKNSSVSEGFISNQIVDGSRSSRAFAPDRRSRARRYSRNYAPGQRSNLQPGVHKPAGIELDDGRRFPSSSRYFGASLSFDGSPWEPCFAVGAALREPFGPTRCEPEFIPVIQCAPLRIAPMAPLLMCREPVALPLRSVLTPWAEAIAGMPITTAAARQAVGKLNRTVIFFRDAVLGR
jgi:hypothetical protein